MQARRKAFAVGWAALGLTGLFAACGTASNDPSPDGGEAGSETAGTSNGASSPGGSSNAAGTAAEPQAGARPSEPVAGADQGSGGASGAGAEPSNAGQPGAGGAGVGEPTAGGPECMSHEDCAVFNDCCECDVGAASEEHPECEKLCVQSSCDARGINAEARCSSNRCVFDLSCDHAAVICKAAEPECPAGQVASVVDSCWGPCIDAAQCRDVTDCSSCPAGTVCVENQDSFAFFTQCVEVEQSCASKPTCACVDACSFSCDVTDSGVACFCLVC